MVPKRIFNYSIMPLRNRIYHKISSLLISKSLMILSMSHSNRRDTLEILSNLLENMNEPRKLTQLLYLTNLSYSQLRKYLTMVIDMGLAKKEQSDKFYLVTEDGKFFIDMVKKRTTIKPVVS